MVRRVGFGSGPRERRPASTVEGRSDAASAVAPGGTGPSDPANAEEAQTRRTAPQVLVALILALFVAGWSYGIFWGFRAFGELYARSGDGFDLAALLFTGLWLAFALVGWAFAVVILVVILFGKPLSPERRAEKAARRAARRRARERKPD